MIVITSGGWISTELQADFGKIPPAFLPLNNKRLFELQAKYLSKNNDAQRLFITLPHNFVVDASDELLLKSLRLTPYYVDPCATLGQSLFSLLSNVTLTGDESLCIMHGDTLLEDDVNYSDVIGVSETSDEYLWHRDENYDEQGEFIEDKVWNGFFSFRSCKKFTNTLEIASYDFISAVELYRAEYGMTSLVCKNWYDFGHLNTYYRNRVNFTTERSFNTLGYSDGGFQKRSRNRNKIEAELHWFLELPGFLQRYTPKILDYSISEDDTYYIIEYLPIPSLRELYVHGRNSMVTWKRIASLCVDFISKCISDDQKNFSDSSYREILYGKKSRERLQAFKDKSSIDWNSKSIQFNGIHVGYIDEIMEDCISKSLKIPPRYGVVHGDLCFSNILYDPRIQALKVIDPRGSDGNDNYTVYGDVNYDIAKLVHSAVGMYDFILSEIYTSEVVECDSIRIKMNFELNQRSSEISKCFIDHFEQNGMSLAEVMPLVVLLFLSMLPLHADSTERQLSLLARGISIYTEYLSRNI